MPIKLNRKEKKILVVIIVDVFFSLCGKNAIFLTIRCLDKRTKGRMDERMTDAKRTISNIQLDMKHI